VALHPRDVGSLAHAQDVVISTGLEHDFLHELLILFVAFLNLHKQITSDLDFALLDVDALLLFEIHLFLELRNLLRGRFRQITELMLQPLELTAELRYELAQLVVLGFKV